MNNQPENTIALFEKHFIKNKTMPLDSVIATCVLSACRACHRLDIGEYIYQEIVRLKYFDEKPNVRLITAVRIFSASFSSQISLFFPSFS